MEIHGFNKTTLLDYPEYIAATVFTGGRNFRCPFCHNGELVLDPGCQPLIPEEEVLSYLKKTGNPPGRLCHRRRADSAKGSEGFFAQDLAELDIRLLGYQRLYARSIVGIVTGAPDRLCGDGY